MAYGYRPRFVTETQLLELVNLYHLARTGLAEMKGRDTPYDRTIWAARKFAEANPDVKQTAAYKDLGGALRYADYRAV